MMEIRLVAMVKKRSLRRCHLVAAGEPAAMMFKRCDCTINYPEEYAFFRNNFICSGRIHRGTSGTYAMSGTLPACLAMLNSVCRLGPP